MITSTSKNLLFQLQQENITHPNSTVGLSNNVESINTKRLFIEIFIVTFFVLGVFGNIVALFTLFKQTFLKQTKQAFFLRHLLANNLISLLGMLLQSILEKILPKIFIVSNMKYFCGGRVVWRYFGLSSGCVAFIMAAERWLSLAKPFIYRKHITMKLIKRSMYLLWLVAAILTFMPFAGFGLFYDHKKNSCLRYRNAQMAIDITYAYIFFTFGILICAGIVFCNIFVTRVLCIAGLGRSERLVRYSENTKQLSSLERRFIKIIILLSISFVICWMPQMISIVIAQVDETCKFRWFFLLSDILMAIHFGADPYFYVLLRPKQRTFLSNILKQSSSIKLTTNST